MKAHSSILIAITLFGGPMTLNAEEISLRCQGAGPSWTIDWASETILFQDASHLDDDYFTISKATSAAGYVTDFVRVFWAKSRKGNEKLQLVLVRDSTCTSETDAEYTHEVILVVSDPAYNDVVLYGCCS